MKTKLFQLVLILILFSCNYISQEQSNLTHIRAVVVNPKKPAFYISHDFFQQNADTLILSNNNEASKNLEIENEGLYVLRLFPEYQTIYLKPNDSLAIHINVDEFDESLSFSGGLGFENNLLVDLFLINERQSELYFKQKSAITLKNLFKQIDSFTTIKKKLLDDYNVELKETTNKYKQIVNLYINSTSYSIKEDYIRNHPKEHFSKTFLAYREVLKKPLPDSRIIDMYNFADIYLSNIVPENGNDKELFFQNLLETCKENIADDTFRSAILTRYCFGYITNNKVVNKNVTVESYFNAINNEQNISYCKKIIQKNKRLHEYQNFPSVQLKTPEGKKVFLDSLLNNKQSIISVWDLYWKKNFEANNKKLAKIKEQYPEIQVIIVNKNYNDFDGWKQVIPTNSSFRYYQITCKKDADLIMPYSFAQVYLLKSDTIYNSMVNIFSVGFENELSNFGAN